MPVDPPLEQPRYPDLAGKIAVVTGGSRGIGAATARALAANGAAVAVVGRDEDALAAVTDDIQARGGRALAARADCTIEAEISRAAHTITAQVGPVDILAAFAGGNGMPTPTAKETAAHWREVIESDLTATFLTTSQFMPGMIERHHGSIITMSSAAARQAAQSNAAYAAAKAGVIAFTRHLANEIAPHGIRVNCLAPSAIENDRMPNMDNRRTAPTARSLIPAPADRPARRRRRRHPVPRLQRLLLDHRHHTRHRRRQNHALSLNPRKRRTTGMKEGNGRVLHRRSSESRWPRPCVGVP